MQVTLNDQMGSDLTVVNAARVSFNQRSDLIGYKDKRLIAYLAKHHHWSPFAHCCAQFYIKAPLFVARQLAKHQVGLAWNEISRRYVSTEPELYFPSDWRIRPPNIKQGSGTELYEQSLELNNVLRAHLGISIEIYNKMVADGIAPEQARMILPLNMYTEWVWTGSLYAWARVCNLRLDPATQKETTYVAAQIATYMAELFPISWVNLTLVAGELPSQ